MIAFLKRGPVIENPFLKTYGREAHSMSLFFIHELRLKFMEHYYKIKGRNFLENYLADFIFFSIKIYKK